MCDYIFQDGVYEPWPDGPQLPDEFEGNIPEELGYAEVAELELGASEAGFWVLVNERQDERPDVEHAFMVELHVGSLVRNVYVRELTQLVRLLGELAPIATAGLASRAQRNHPSGW